MNYKEHWAIFVEGEEVRWTFGDPKKEFQQIIADFLRGMGAFGEEFFGEGIASITFDLPQFSKSAKTTEIFIVSLQDHFFFIISDPAITLKLISAEGGIPFIIKQVMTAVLVGQAAILYANSTDETIESQRDEITTHFQNIILDINPIYREDNQVNTIVGKAGTNFGILTFEECILFHFFLRKQAEKSFYVTPSSWCIISNQDGGDIPFSFNIEDDTLIGGYFSAIIGLLSTLFNAKPRFLAFGSTSIRKLRFVYGNRFFMAIDKSFMTDLLLSRKFQKKFLTTSYSVIKDLAAGLKELISDEILELSKNELTHLSAESLLEKYMGETAEFMTFFIDEGEDESKLQQEERINQVLRVWGRYLAEL